MVMKDTNSQTEAQLHLHIKSIENNIETIECEMQVTCIDYIIDNEEKLIKGKKDKFCNYTYRLVFNKDLSNNKYTLIEKKMLKQQR